MLTRNRLSTQLRQPIRLSVSPRFFSRNTNVLEAMAWQGMPGHASEEEVATSFQQVLSPALEWQSASIPVVGEWLLLRWHGVGWDTSTASIATLFAFCEHSTEHLLVFAVPSTNRTVQLFALLHNSSSMVSSPVEAQCDTRQVYPDTYRQELSAFEASRIVKAVGRFMLDFAGQRSLFSLFDSQSDNYVSLTLICDDGTIYRQ